MAEHYDLFVIGGGSGGLAAAKKAADNGAKVAVADHIDPSWAGTTWGIGGTCLNVGCIPKKLFHQAALHRENHVLATGLGWDTKATHNWENMMQLVNNYIKKQNWGHKSDLRSKKVKYYNMIAVFGDKKGPAHAVELYSKRPDKGGELKETVTADKVIVATGGRPSDGGFEGVEHTISSDDIFWKKEAPGKTLVVGASYIALECAGFLNGLGFDTSVMVRSVPLRMFDQDCATRIAKFMEEDGVKFLHKKVPKKFEKVGSQIKVSAENVLTKTVEEIGTFDTVLMAIGRNGCAQWLRTDKAGIACNKWGDKVLVDANDATNVPGVYALGDVAEGRPELTPVAIMSGRLLADRLFAGKSQLMDYDQVPTTVFTPLEFGTCGVSEDDAAKEDGKYDIYCTIYTPLEWRTCPEERLQNKCMFKLIVRKADGVVAGVQLLGPQAGEILQGFSIAIKAGVTKDTWDSVVGIHPTMAEECMQMTEIKLPGQEVAAKTGC